MKLVALFALLATIGQTVTSIESDVDEPMVAFVCNRPAMYATNRGWTPDETTSCIKDPVDVLNYCRKVYPDRDVWNVVEASEMVTIRNWCNFGHTKCRHRFTVRPFRCLVGAFQSEALQVPDQCVFDHVHGAGSKDCQSSSAWNRTAHQACIDRHGSSQSQLHGFAVLQPCGIDGFGGVEFVCCPAPLTTSRTVVATTSGNLPEMTTSTRRHHVRRTTVGSLTTAPRMTRKVPTTATTTWHNKPTVGTTPRPSTVVASTTIHHTAAMKSLEATEQLADDFDDDWHDDTWKKLGDDADSDDGGQTEHDRFVKLKAQLEKRHHEKVAKMMKEWAAARRRVQEIKHIDARGGEKFNREMTARFQKAYESLERETAAERKKLLSEHQRRIQDELSRRKSQALDLYMSAVNDRITDATKILKALEQYVKAEQKDRVHTIQHYKQVEESDPVEAESQRAAVSSHLRGIDERVTQAIEMLSRLPKFEKKIRQQIEKFLSRYQSLDESLAVIMAKINEQLNGNRVQAMPQWSRDLTIEQPFVTTTFSAETSSSDAGRYSTEIPRPRPGVDTTVMTSSVAWETASENPVAVTDYATYTTSEGDADVSKSREMPSVIVDHISAVAHNQKNDLVVLESYIKKFPIRADSVGHLAAPLAIVACGFAVFVVVAVGVAVVRRRMSMTGDVAVASPSVGPAGTVTEVDRSALALAANRGNFIDPRLAINGYENPTYQFYVAAEAEAVRKATAASQADA